MKTANLILIKTPDLTESAYHEAGQAIAAVGLGQLRKKDHVAANS
jgi:hypothetical protein